MLFLGGSLLQLARNKESNWNFFVTVKKHFPYSFLYTLINLDSPGLEISKYTHDCLSITPTWLIHYKSNHPPWFLIKHENTTTTHFETNLLARFWFTTEMGVLGWLLKRGIAVVRSLTPILHTVFLSSVLQKLAFLRGENIRSF